MAVSELRENFLSDFTADLECALDFNFSIPWKVSSSFELA